MQRERLPRQFERQLASAQTQASACRKKHQSNGARVSQPSQPSDQ
ncbi:hypothetical protein EBBID32_27700 [Sphingobium indicum BiD32]|uniref:Uncharacterized protein n=1 Tax=Sphingobium indicum BiD32 TaxID=1301087 RepID=N1MRW6_9SPHN|nr:hypothetical protein EBBID32_27700 [Sphingobium indicum BiD32]